MGRDDYGGWRKWVVVINCVSASQMVTRFARIYVYNGIWCITKQIQHHTIYFMDKTCNYYYWVGSGTQQMQRFVKAENPCFPLHPASSCVTLHKLSLSLGGLSETKKQNGEGGCSGEDDRTKLPSPFSPVEEEEEIKKPRETVATFLWTSVGIFLQLKRVLLLI